MKTKTRSLLVLICAVSLVALGLPGMGRAQSDPKVIEAAKKEGQLNWYATTNIRDGGKFIKGFNKKYPFIKVQHLNMGSGQAINRVVTEARAGVDQVDVLNVNDVEAVHLAKKGFFAKYDSAELKNYPEDLKDPLGFWFPFKNLPLVIGYNTQLVAPGEAPGSYEDLLDPKWKGKILMDREEYRLYNGLIQYWGEERARGYLKKLSKQDIQWRRGHTLLAQVLLAGEAPVGLVFAHHAEIFRSKGAPIDWETRLDPVLLSANVNFIVEKAPHPNAARLFVDFTLSKEGQEIMADAWRITPHPNVQAKTPKLDPKNLKIWLVRAISGDKVQSLVNEWREIFDLK